MSDDDLLDNLSLDSDDGAADDSNESGARGGNTAASLDDMLDGMDIDDDDDGGAKGGGQPSLDDMLDDVDIDDDNEDLGSTVSPTDATRHTTVARNGSGPGSASAASKSSTTVTASRARFEALRAVAASSEEAEAWEATMKRDEARQLQLPPAGSTRARACSHAYTAGGRGGGRRRTLGSSARGSTRTKTDTQAKTRAGHRDTPGGQVEEAEYDETDRITPEALLQHVVLAAAQKAGVFSGAGSSGHDTKERLVKLFGGGAGSDDDDASRHQEALALYKALLKDDIRKLDFGPDRENIAADPKRFPALSALLREGE